MTVKRVDNGEKLVYNCNAIQTWYITLVAFFTLQFTGIFDFAIIIENLAPLTVTAVIFADVVAIIAYLSCVFSKNQYNPSGNTIYDFFIGVWLHPRIGKDVLFFHFFFFFNFFFSKGTLDLKMFSEIRWSWFILFSLTFSSAAYQDKT